MLENQIPKYQFTVMDHTDKKKKTILSITDLGEVGRKRSITVRKENKIIEINEPMAANSMASYPSVTFVVIEPHINIGGKKES